MVPPQPGGDCHPRHPGGEAAGAGQELLLRWRLRSEQRPAQPGPAQPGPGHLPAKRQQGQSPYPEQCPKQQCPEQEYPEQEYPEQQCPEQETKQHPARLNPKAVPPRQGGQAARSKEGELPNGKTLSHIRRQPAPGIRTGAGTTTITIWENKQEEWPFSYCNNNFPAPEKDLPQDRLKATCPHHQRTSQQTGPKETARSANHPGRRATTQAGGQPPRQEGRATRKEKKGEMIIH